ncbi:DNA-binding protein [Massilia sp. SM-13]|uniref:DNA-binding protein n=1 Tax=Pseudoduganella rhizocola TaxID=3382643 RepID=UPI0038B63EEA
MPRGITETDVWHAADALLLAGDRPTIERVRQQLGRGSPNTVSPHLDTWFRGLGARIKDPQAFAAPAAVPDPIAQAAAHFWQVALADARRQLETEVAREHHELAAAKLQLDDARLALAQQENVQMARQEGIAAAMRAMESQLHASNERVASLEQQLADATREGQALEAQCLAHENDKEALRAQLQDERTRQEAARIKLEERAAANEQRWSLEVDRARESAKQAQAQLSRSETLRAEQLSGWNTERDRLEAGLATMTERLTRQQSEVDQAKAMLAIAENSLLAATTSAAQREITLLSQIERLQNQLSAALDQLKVKDDEQSALLRSFMQSMVGNTKRSGRRGSNAASEG